MRLLYLLLLLIPLAIAECPPILEGIEANNSLRIIKFDEVMETVCGERNYTSTFWQPAFWFSMVSTKLLTDKYGDHMNSTDDFKPLFESLQKQIDSLDNVDAKSYMEDLIANQRSFLDAKMGAQMLVMMIMKSFTFGFTHQLSSEAEIVMAKAFKNAFQYTETAEMKISRIETAMKAIERVGTLTDDEKLGELFAGIYLLFKKPNSFIMAPFTSYATLLEKDDSNSTEIGYLEVVPAVETLYLQYHTLNNTEAKSFVEWTLANLALTSWNRGCSERECFNTTLPDSREGKDLAYLVDYDDFMKTCPSRNVETCFKDLSEEAKAALTTTFPELLAYIHNGLNPERWAWGPLGEVEGRKKVPPPPKKKEKPAPIVEEKKEEKPTAKPEPKLDVPQYSHARIIQATRFTNPIRRLRTKSSYGKKFGNVQQSGTGEVSGSI